MALQRIAALALGTGVALLAAEGMLRSSSIEHRWVDSFVPTQGADLEVHRELGDSELFYGLEPGATAEYRDGPPWATVPRQVTINSIGFRDPERSMAKPKETLRIACVGGSNTYGAVVTNEETWPAQLESQLTTRLGRPVEAWNLGVSGYVLHQKLLLARRSTERFDVDLVLLQVHNAGPRLLLARADAMGTLADSPSYARELLVGVPLSDTSAFSWLWRHSTLLRVVLVGVNRLAVSREWQFYKRYQGTRIEELERQAVRKFLADHPSDIPVLLVLPLGGTGDGTALNEAGFPLIDVRTGLRASNEEDRQIHPGAGVYARTASFLADELLARGCLSSDNELRSRCKAGAEPSPEAKVDPPVDWLA